MSNLINEIKATYRSSDVWLEPLQMLPLIQGFEHIPIVSFKDSLEPIYSLIPDIEHMIDIVKQHYHSTENNLTYNETASILLYSMEWTSKENSFSYYFNQILRSDNRELFKPWLFYFKLLLTSYFKLPNQITSTVYHCIPINLSSRYIQGSTCIWWGLSLCTMSEEYVQSFLNEQGIKTLFKIQCQTGKDIHQYTLFPEQEEVLFLPARQFQIVENSQQDNDLYIIHLKEIQPYIIFLQHLSFISDILIRRRSICEYKNCELKYFIDRFKYHNEIKLSKLNLNDYDMEIVGKEAINKKNCLELSLNDNQITCEGVLFLALVLYNNLTLRKFILTQNLIADLGVKYLSQIFANGHTNLRILDLSSNKITYQGMEYISEMLKTNETLRSLWLNGNKINDQGVDALMNCLAIHNRTLKFLRLSSHQTITDGSIDSIVNMLQCNTTLMYLDIQQCNFSLNGKRLLEKAVRFKQKFYLDI